MLSINTYLYFTGNAAAAMNYYKSVLGGHFTAQQRYKDMAGGHKMEDEDQEKIIHIALQVTANITIMATDLLPSMQMPFNAGNNFHICIQAENEAEADRLFAGLSEGGKIETPLNKTFWGAYFGTCRDQFDVPWMINCEKR